MNMSNKGRYIITVKQGKKILDRRYYNNYDLSMDELDFIEENADKLYDINAIVEFKDSTPFK
jgi:hypothetical protein